MVLSDKGLQNKGVWECKGYTLPTYDRGEMIARTKQAPVWVHFGAGNIFRAFHAHAAQKLLNEGLFDRGILVVEGFDYEIVEKMYRPHDDLSVLVTLKADGSVEKTVVGSIAESLLLDSETDREFSRLKEIFSAPSLQLATFTITEKGYSLVNGRGERLPAVAADMEAGPERPRSYIGKVAALLYARYLAGGWPIALVSTDNCSHNGDKLFAAVVAFADAWQAKGAVPAGFVQYLRDKSTVSFPWTMIDKITPRPDPSVSELLRRDGLEDLEPVVTSKNTYVAPFVNAEECEYLVIEDDFPAGRPPLEKAGFLFTNRQTVDKVERMKVCTCLNPLHTALAVFGCLLGFGRISEEMKDPQLRRLAERIGYEEGLPVVTDPGILDPKEFIDTVLTRRIPNPFMPDTPQRIATDTSQKLSVRFGETIKNYRAAGLPLSDLKLIPLVFAGWLRYLMGIDDGGEPFELSPDPLLDALRPHLASVTLGYCGDAEFLLRPILQNQAIFGVDLYEAGLAGQVLDYFRMLIAAPGSVRDTLKRFV